MKIDKCEKPVCNLYDKTNYAIRIKALKQAIEHGLILDKVHTVIEFSQEALLNSYICMDTELITKGKNDFDEGFLKLMNNLVFGRAEKNVRDHRGIKLMTNSKKRIYLVNYHTTKYFSKNLLEI